MGLEAATYIHQLDPNNPVGGIDPVGQGDDHLKLIKLTLQATFAGITGAVTVTHAQINTVCNSGLTGFAAPSVAVGIGAAAVGVANTALRSDAKLILDQSIAPVWTGQHAFDLVPTVEDVAVRNAAILNVGELADARVKQTNVTQHQGALAIATTQLTGVLPDARVAQSNVTQHQGALAIQAGQITTLVFSEPGGIGLTGEEERFFRCTGGGVITVGDTAGSNFESGDSVAFMRDTVNAVTFAASGVQVIKSPGGRLSIPEQNGIATLTYLGDNIWVLSGV